ncbi:hypothetical protein ACHAPJ_009933 [Fusarium lateritium]
MTEVEPRKLNVALVGLGFGAEFVPIYQAHPNVASVAVCDSDHQVIEQIRNRFNVNKSFKTLDDVLLADDIDTVHLITPIPQHAQQTIAVLRAGKNCACTVPMATSLPDLQDIIAAQRETGKTYMMMETAVYTREFLMVQERHRRGDFGQVSFAKGSHMQDMEGWPSYWMGLPPHHYMTHAISPILHLLNTSVAKVHCFGSGQLPQEERRAAYGNPFPVETAIFRLRGSNVAVEVTRALFQTVRPYTEAFSFYGDKLGFEWQQIESERPIIYTLPPYEQGRHREFFHEAVEPEDRPDLLPPELAPFTKASVHEDGQHLSFVQGGGHGGSHPHLVHEFVSSIIEKRRPAIDAVTAARWTAPGIAAHMSAMRDGEAVELPDFSMSL